MNMKNMRWKFVLALFLAMAVFVAAFAGEAPAANKLNWGKTEAPSILVNDEAYYYLEGVEGAENIKFYKDGRVQYNSVEGIYVREYRISGDIINVTDDGKQYKTLEILDLCTLTDEDGNTYAISGSVGQEFETDSISIFYANADIDAGSLMFWPGGTVKIESADGDEMSGTYEVDDDTISIEIDGDSLELDIVNRRVLKLDDDTVFVRTYP